MQLPADLVRNCNRVIVFKVASVVWGTVPMSHIKGKALIIWWSSGAPEGVRWGRFFNLVHSLPAKTSPITP